MSLYNNGTKMPSPHEAANGFPQPSASGTWHKPEEEVRLVEASLVKKAHREILDHERKRRVELKCMELQEMMEEQGYSEEEIRQKVGTFRQMLMEKEGVLTREDQHGRSERWSPFSVFSSLLFPRSRSPKTKRKEKNKERKRSHSNSPARRSHRHSSCSTHSASLSSDYSDSKSPSRLIPKHREDGQKPSGRRSSRSPSSSRTGHSRSATPHQNGHKGSAQNGRHSHGATAEKQQEVRMLFFYHYSPLASFPLPPSSPSHQHSPAPSPTRLVSYLAPGFMGDTTV
uniref:Serine/arginine repetitive matrix 3 n=1 Tax=Sphenodon punctatus TaxID=8508 RepID=A0A8D0GKK8_SPHPU